MSDLVPGGNVPLSGGPVSVRVPDGFDVSALVTDDGGKVGGDEDFVFYNQPQAHGCGRTRSPSIRRGCGRAPPG